MSSTNRSLQRNLAVWPMFLLLSFSWSPDPAVGRDRFEPNDSIHQSSDLGVAPVMISELNVHLSDEFSNDDWYAWTAREEAVLGVEIEFRHALGDLDLELYDADQNLLDRSSSSDDREAVSTRVRRGETCFVRIFGYENATNPNYDLSITLGDSPFFEGRAAWDMPDLSVTTLIAEPERVALGDHVAINTTVVNRGSGMSRPTVLQVSIGDNVLQRFDIGEVSPGKEVRFMANWIANEAGSHPLVAEILLAGDDIEELYRNNVLTAKVRVGSDAPIPELDVYFAEPDVAALISAESTRLRVVVRNPSFATVAEIPASFFIDGAPVRHPNDANGAPLLRTIGPLQPGEEQGIEVPWRHVRSGEHTLSMHMELPDNFPDAEFQRSRGWHFVVAPAHHEPTPLPATGQGSASGEQLDEWFSIGPRLLLTDNGEQWNGKMTDIAFDPSNVNIIYAGGEGFRDGGAGLWKTTNGGDGWTPLIDKLPSTSVGAVAVDPAHPNIVYLAVLDAGKPTAGLYKSTDGGSIWHLFASRQVFATNGRRLVVRHPSPGEVVIYAATNRGVLRYHSNDAFATASSGNDWTVMRTGEIADIAVSPKDDSRVYASIYGTGNGLFRTTVGLTATGNGDWTHLTNGLPPIPADRGVELAGRFTVDVQRANPDVLYAEFLRPDASTYVAIYRSTNGGDQWNTIKTYQTGTKELGGSAYNPYIRVHPTDPSIFYFGGVNLFKGVVASDGTVTHTKVKGVAFDHKELLFSPHTTNTYYTLGDQGIFRGTVAATGDTTIPRNFDLRVGQLFDIDVVPPGSSVNFVIGGTQDTGTIMLDPDAAPNWRIIKGGDGNYSLITDQGRTLYAQHQKMSETVRSDAGVQTKAGDWKGGKKGFHPPPGAGYGDHAFIAKHPNNPDVILAEGDQVYATTDRGFTPWDPRGPRPTSTDGHVHRIAVQPSSSAWFAGTSGGEVWTSSTGGTGTWSLLASRAFDRASVSGMAFSPADDRILYVTYRGGEGYRRIQRFESQSDGHWASTWIANNLDPAYQPLAIAGDPFDPNIAFTGTIRGVFRYDYDQPTYNSWKPYNVGLPLTKVSDLVVNPLTNELIASTMSRGVWSVGTGTAPAARMVGMGVERGVVTTTSTSPVDIPSMSTLVITSELSNLAVTFSAEWASVSSGRMFVEAVVDGASFTNVVFTTDSERSTRSYTFYKGNLSPGTHEVKLRWSVDSGATGSLFGTDLVATAAPPSGNRLSLVGVGIERAEVRTTSTSFVDVPGMSTSITTSEPGNLAVSFSAELARVTSGRMLVDAVVDGQAFTNVVFTSDTPHRTQSYTFFKENVAPGTHNVKIQWAVDSGATASLFGSDLVVIAAPSTGDELVAGVGIERSEVTTTSTSYVDVPAMFTSIIASELSNLAVTFSAEWARVTSGRMFINAVLDGQGFTNVVFASDPVRQTRSYTFYIDNVPPGTHNIRVQWMVDSGATGSLWGSDLVVTAVGVKRQP